MFNLTKYPYCIVCHLNYHDNIAIQLHDFSLSFNDKIQISLVSTQFLFSKALRLYSSFQKDDFTSSVMSLLKSFFLASFNFNYLIKTMFNIKLLTLRNYDIFVSVLLEHNYVTISNAFTKTLCYCINVQYYLISTLFLWMKCNFITCSDSRKTLLN